MTNENLALLNLRIHPSLARNWGGRLKLQFSLHRLFTYPRDFQETFSIDPQELAEAGLVFSGKILHCCFCAYTIGVDNIQGWKNLSAVEILLKINTPDCQLNSGNTENVPICNISHALNYIYEAHRLYSLMIKKDWQYVNVFDLAKTGFYYTGQDDNCRCTFCHLEVRGWEEGDTPEGEHLRWNSQCPFLKGRHNVLNIEIGLEETNISHDCITHSRKTSSISSDNPFKASGNLTKYGTNLKLKTCYTFILTSTNLNVMDWSQPKNLRFASISNRIKSFKNWPISLEQKPAQLTFAGFYYTGQSDRVICFHCNLGLKDWAPEDEPSAQHARWNSGCQFLLLSKGPGFVENTLHSTKSDRAVLKPHSKEEYISNLTCRKCGTHRVSKVSLPCGHIQLCLQCEEDKCPACNSKIIAEVHFFF